jgi:hypothetical protein
MGSSGSTTLYDLPDMPSKMFTARKAKLTWWVFRAKEALALLLF